MPKVKMLRSFAGMIDGNAEVRAGQVIEVSQPAAEDLVAQGHAELVAEPKPKKVAKKATAKVETASVKAPEAAMQPKAEPRDG